MSPKNTKDQPLRTEPQSIEAEKAVLGSIILEPTLWDSLSVEIDENDFISNEHKVIFRGINIDYFDPTTKIEIDEKNLLKKWDI